MELLGGDALQTAEERVRSRIRARQEDSQPPEVRGEERVQRSAGGERQTEDRVGTRVARQRCQARGVVHKDDAVHAYSLCRGNIGWNIVDEDTGLGCQAQHREHGTRLGAARRDVDPAVDRFQPSEDPEIHARAPSRRHSGTRYRRRLAESPARDRGVTAPPEAAQHGHGGRAAQAEPA